MDIKLKEPALSVDSVVAVGVFSIQGLKLTHA